ncbi:MAG: decarboxylating 6-phosphogluconate dehydrogenase [Chloroflexi bacterium]|nr:decarboxylating 6-phosphogluconate dehydrogenase [Chloroflexota bacterium]
MQIVMIGLGKMGGNMARRLISAGHKVIGYNNTPEVTEKMAAQDGLAAAFSLEEAAGMFEGPRVFWVMVPAGEPTESTVMALSELLSKDDVIIDGGNSNFNDSMRRSELLAEKGIHFLDVGVSGGVWGLKEGYSMMIGGEVEIVEQLRSIFESLAPAADKGWGRVGPNGAGHFVKMVHNGIEYGLMQAYAEGFEIMKARQDFDLDLHGISEIWQHGSVVRSWLLDLTTDALAEDQELSNIRGWVADSGEGRWTVFEAINQDVPAPVITMALLQRFVSRQEESYAAKLLAAMRNQFGGHAVRKADE